MFWDMDSILIYQLELHILGVSPWPTLESEYGSPTRNVTLQLLVVTAGQWGALQIRS